MTIKEWFYKHTNVTFVLLALVTSITAALTLYSLSYARWGFAVLYGLFTFMWSSFTVNWWEKNQ